MEYTFDADDCVLQRIHNMEGYIDRVDSINGLKRWNYFRKDHLGNNREVWHAKYNKLIIEGAIRKVQVIFPQTVQRTRYYPSGLPWEYQAGDSASLQPRKYGGKEFVEAHGLDMYDSHARWYDPLTFRTPTPDPHCENYYSISPYVWCGNNPVNWVDPDGRDYWMTDNLDYAAEFISAVERGDSFFDFSEWSHYSNKRQIEKSQQGVLTYNDETNVYYRNKGELIGGELISTGTSGTANILPVSFDNFGYEGAFVYEGASDFWDYALYYVLDWNAEYSNKFFTWNVNTEGRITGVKPMGGTPPLPGMKGGKFVQKMGRAKGNMTGNRNIQQKQFDTVVKKLGLSKQQAQQLHKSIHNQGYGYQEILEEAKCLFNK